MKVKFYHTFYSLFSYLSDKTNGASLFVKYKLILGSLLIGLTAISCDKEKEEEPEVTCYIVAPSEQVETKPTPSPDADTLIIPNDSLNQKS